MTFNLRGYFWLENRLYTDTGAFRQFPLYNSATMFEERQEIFPIADMLKLITERIESIFAFKLTCKDIKFGHEEITHVYLREACRATLTHFVSWISTLPEKQQKIIEEIMVRLLESEIGSSLGIFVQGDQVFLEALKGYLLLLSQEEFAHLKDIWQIYFWPKHDLAGMATYLLTILRYGRVIYHILPVADWQNALKKGTYTPSSLVTEGFIHCSDIDQVLGSAKAYFAGEHDLFLVCIAMNRILPEVHYESPPSENAKGFPHIYGPLNLEAVVNVSSLLRDVQGDFVLPQYPQALMVRGDAA